MGRRRTMPSKGKAGRREQRVPEPSATAEDDGGFAGDEIWPDDLPARDINADLDEPASDETAMAGPAGPSPIPDPAPAPAPISEIPIAPLASDAQPQVEFAPNPDEGAAPDLFDDHLAGTSGPSGRRAAPRRPRSPKKVETAVQLELWPAVRGAGRQGEG